MHIDRSYCCLYITSSSILNCGELRVTCQISVIVIILINLDPLTRTKVDVTVDSYRRFWELGGKRLPKLLNAELELNLS